MKRACLADHLGRWWPLSVWGAVVLAVAAGLAITLIQDRARGMKEAALRSQAMADLGAEHVRHLYESADAALKVARPLFLRNPDWDRLAADADAWRLLRDLGHAQPSIPTLHMSDETGRFRMHASVFPAPDKSIAERAYFQHLRDTPMEAPYISEPVVGMVIGQPTLLLTQRLTYPDGRFAGLLSANLDPQVAAEFFATLGAGEGGIINLQRGDGTILARHPALKGAVGSRVDNSKAFSSIAEGASYDSKVTISPLDKVARVTSFRRLKTYDLLVLAAIPVERVLEPWRRHSIRMVAVVGFALAALTLVFVLLLRRYHAEKDMLLRLQSSEADLIQAQQVAKLGYYVYDFTTDNWQSSAILDAIFGIGADYDRSGRGWLALVAPSARAEMEGYLRGILAGEHDFDREYPILRPSDGAERWMAGLGRLERDDSGRAVRLVGTIRDVTERKVAELALRDKAEELARSNTELEQFAYVASHDLREPLRMVSSYVDLLDRRYGGRLDDEAREFIAFARDGAKRMDHLVLDLLEYSRIGRIVRPMATVALDKVLDHALKSLRVKIEEGAAEIIRPTEPLPQVWGDGEELARLFQNLIGNALKYRRPDRPPVVTITVEPSGDGWEIGVADNGIGIDSQHFDRIFLIFHRLHRREDYEGTGIGLAICKKIAEHHGGRITVESVLGEGSVFRVFLRQPKA